MKNENHKLMKFITSGFLSADEETVVLAAKWEGDLFPEYIEGKGKTTDEAYEDFCRKLRPHVT